MPVRQACAAIVQAAQGAGHPVRNVWGYATTRDHNNRRCVDFMVSSWADGEWIHNWAWDKRDVLQVDLIIWWGTITRTKSHFPWKAGKRAPYLLPNRHHDHVHIQFTGNSLPGPKGPFLGPYEVNPDLVHTFLWARDRAWGNGKQRAPGFKVKTGVRIVRHDGEDWVETQAGYKYALRYLRLVK